MTPSETSPQTPSPEDDLTPEETAAQPQNEMPDAETSGAETPSAEPAPPENPEQETAEAASEEPAEAAPSSAEEAPSPTPNEPPAAPPASEEEDAPILPPSEDEEEKRRRKILLAALLALVAALCLVAYLFVRYLNRPEPLPELLPVPVEVNYPPHYLFAIYDVDAPLGVALSPEGDRLYVTESRGERLIKIFDTKGNLLGSFAPPRTTPAERSPVYIATDAQGRVFVTDRLQHAVFVYDRDGNYLDTILAPTLTLSEYIAKHTGAKPQPGTFAYDIFEEEVHYQDTEGNDKTLPRPDRPTWAPLGVAFTTDGRLILTDVGRKEGKENHRVLIFPAEIIAATDWTEFNPAIQQFGSFGEADDQFQFPNMAVLDAQGRFIVSDGNNGRLSVWDAQGNFLYLLGAGTGAGALNLPRGLFLDDRQRLYVADAVGQAIRVYDFAAEEPTFLFSFGVPGTLKGQFNYPNAVVVDASGRLYITDRENNRVQVWSY